MSATKSSGEGAAQPGLCWALAVAWLIAFLFSQLHAGTPSGTYAGAVQGLLMALVVIMHGQLAYGWKGLGAYVFIVASVSFSLESCSIATGIPFGFFTHNLQGPKPLGVPIPVVMGYVVLGWLFAGWVFFQLFALVESRFHSSAASRRFDFWLLPCLMWLGISLQYPILFAAAPGGTVERGGRSFMVSDIYEAAVAGCLFTMVLPALIALIRLNAQRNAAASGSA